MVGSNVTETLQDAPGASAFGRVPQVVAVCSKSPLNWKLSRVSGVVAEFLMVTVLKALVVPTGAEKVVIDTGVMVTGALPEPVSVTTCGLFEASSIMLSVAVLAPEAVGVKVTESVQLDVTGTEEGTVGQEFVTPKSPLFAPETETPDMLSGIFCWLLTLTVWPALVVPSNCAAKVNFSEVGEIATGAIPFPESVIVCGLLLALVVMVTEPAGWVPNATGVRVRPMVQLAPGVPLGANEPELGHVVDGSMAYGLPGDRTRDAILRATDWLFLSVTTLIALVSLITTLPKFTDVGVSVVGVIANAEDVVNRQNIAVSESVTAF